MKKLCLLVVIVGTLLLCGCGQKTEYTMKELEDQIVAVNKAYDEKTKDLTEEEIEKQGVGIFVEEAEKQGLPVDTEITLRGKVYDAWCNEKGCSITLMGDEMGEDKEVDYDKTLYCSFEEKKNDLMFLEQNENIVIKGIFCDEKKSFGLSKCKIVSPEEIDVPEFDCNIEDYFNDASEEEYYYEPDVIINGVVHSVFLLDDKNALYEECGDDKIYKSAIENNKYLVLIKDDKNEDDFIMWYTNTYTCKEGDKIALKATLSNVRDGELKGLLYAKPFLNDVCYVYK